MIDRRQMIGLGFAGLMVPGVSFAAGRGAGEQRFVFVIQRGAADGLAILQPTGDPAYAGLRGALAVPGGAAIDPFFTLHPSLPGLAASYRAGEALFVHAVASPYRERSHFDGQNVLETGGARAYERKDGWVNRMTGLLPGREALALAPTVPAALRGPAPVTSYAASVLPDPNADLLARVSALYAADPELHPVWEQAKATHALAGGDADGRNAAAQGKLAADFLKQPTGPRIAMIETGSWDTHAGQNSVLGTRLKGLDELLGALKNGLGPLWADTLVVVATEFGRTAAANGTGGTDHGTASLAMVVGGKVAGGRVLADWPGLAPASLLDSRDLRPTRSLDAVIAGAAAQHFALDPALALRRMFPGAAPADRAAEGLVRA